MAVPIMAPGCHVVLADRSYWGTRSGVGARSNCMGPALSAGAMGLIAPMRAPCQTLGPATKLPGGRGQPPLGGATCGVGATAYDGPAGAGMPPTTACKCPGCGESDRGGWEIPICGGGPCRNIM